MRGTLFERSDQFDLAAADFDKAIELNPGLDRAWFYRCWSEGESAKNLSRALEDCNAAFSRQPPLSTPPFAARALVYYRLGRPSEAIEDADAALKVNPANGVVLYIRGLARQTSGQGSLGDADLRAALSMRPHLDVEFAKAGITSTVVPSTGKAPAP